MTQSNPVNNLKIGELPCLRIVPINSLIFHEDYDTERLLRLVERLGTETILKNPPIVARINGNPNLIILDGANRTTALQRLGFEHILIQEVNFDDKLLQLNCWHHAIEKLDRGYFLLKLSRINGIKTIEREPFVTNGNIRQEITSENNYLCRLIFRDNSVVAVKGSDDLLTQIRQLVEITKLYLNTPYTDRVSYIDIENLKQHYPDFQSLMTFRQYTKENFLAIIKSGMRLPPGVTRVFLPKRALGLNIHLEFLKSNLSLDEKNQWLEKMIIDKVRDKSIRFYREPTFRFDE